MPLYTKALSLGLSLMLALPCSATRQELPPPDLPAELWENYKSPVTTEARYLLIMGGGILTSLLLFREETIDPVQMNFSENKPLGPYSYWGDLGGQGYPNAFYIGGMLAHGQLDPEAHSTRLAISMFEASAYAILTTAALKFIVGQPRPDDPKTLTSFPSGHTTAAFAFASYVGCRHSWPWGVGAYSLATLTGLSRINDNRHYLHDVVAGATIGGSFGLGICLRENEKVATTAEPVSWLIVPVPAKEGALVGVWRWAF